jgi:hypothetical protein
MTHRLPKRKAEVSGAALHNPARYRGRSASTLTRPIGDPYPRMTGDQKACWDEFRAALPWLNGSHRTLLRLACMLSVRMDDPEIGVNATAALSSILSKLGATPIDETRVSLGHDQKDDPDDRFFSNAR